MQSSGWLQLALYLVALAVVTKPMGLYLLQVLDPTIDMSLGDLIAVRSLRNTFFGAGVSHRSGIFGSSQLLGNVNGGSNYIYGYLETSF